MDDECRGVRQRKKQADPTCCPVCGVTVRAHEMDQHYSMEMDRLNKLTIQKCRKSQPKDMPMPTSSQTPSTATASTAEHAKDTKDCWNTYQRIKNNRSARLKVAPFKSQITCVVFNCRFSDRDDLILNRFHSKLLIE